MAPEHRSDAHHAAACIYESRYPTAQFLLLAGSVVRGNATAYSDLDLVVVFDQVEHPYRESFFWEGWPVEVFAHDPQTAQYFFTEVDRPAGNCSLPSMVLEGIEVPGPTLLSASLKAMAQDVIAQGPPSLTEQDLRTRRYLITDLVDDIRSPRSTGELVATGSRLYEVLADCYLRMQNQWSGQGKALLRQLGVVDDVFAARYVEAFTALFCQHDAQEVVALAEETLRPHGGWLFDGHRLDAPASWRTNLA